MASNSFFTVCEKYFSIYPADKEFLWEVEKIGSPFQRTLIANRLQKLKLKGKKNICIFNLILIFVIICDDEFNELIGISCS